MFFLKSNRLWDNVDKYGTARQVAGNNTKKNAWAFHAGYQRLQTQTQNIIIIAFPL
jgi:hypothetical protein